VSHWQEMESRYFMQNFARVPLTLVRGEGVFVWDEDGRRYLDCVGGWAVTCLGHCHPVIVEAVSGQAATLIHTSNQFYTIPQIELAELLVKNSCLDRVFIANSGTEANEGACKLARRYGELKRGGAYEIITVAGSFHGRTLAMVAATGQPKHQQLYVPLPGGFVNVPNNDIEAVKAATGEKTCAVMLEPLQGEGGVIPPADNYLKEVRKWCDEQGLLLILDEIQTGVGRTGALYAYEHYGIEPDIMTLAKGLGGGMPIGAILCKEAVSVFKPGEHGSTFGGNPVTCAAAVATLRYVLEQDIVSHVRETGDYLIKGLNDLRARFSFITDVRGKGLLVAVEFRDEIGQAVLEKCLAEGLLINRVRPDTIRLMPPLVVNRDEIDSVLAILERVLSGF
jgi:acetylornithine/N-succinyldiaminopimelate aminotransferase